MAGTSLRIEEMPSGTVYGYVLPNIQQMMLSGFFPQPIVPLVRQFISSKLETDREQTDEEIRQWEEFKCRVVAWMVRTEGGELRVRKEGDIILRNPSSGLPETDVVSLGQEVSYKWEDVADPEKFPADDLSALFSRAIRIVAAPKAARPKS